jgi:putative transposase
LSSSSTRLSRKTSLGYKVFSCRHCNRIFNERTGTPFDHLQFPTDIALLVVLWRLRYKQGTSMRARRDLTEMFLDRGFEFSKKASCNRGGARSGSTVRPLDHRTTALQAKR